MSSVLPLNSNVNTRSIPGKRRPSLTEGTIYRAYLNEHNLDKKRTPLKFLYHRFTNPTFRKLYKQNKTGSVLVKEDIPDSLFQNIEEDRNTVNDMFRLPNTSSVTPTYKKGGMIKPKNGKKTEKVTVHKNELIIPANLVKDVPKTLKKKIKNRGGKNM